MGENKWRDEDTWPLERAKRRAISSTPPARPTAPPATERLSTAAGARRSAGQLTSTTPANPVPTVGGPLCCDTEHLAPGPAGIRKKSRAARMCSSTPRRPSSRTLKSPARSRSTCSPSPPPSTRTSPPSWSTCGPDGFAQNLTEGILRAATANRPARPSPSCPAKSTSTRSISGPPATCFSKGHQIRLEVCSSNFPRFDRNLNTGKDAADSSDYVKATNTIFHDAEHPSALLLPVVPRE